MILGVMATIGSYFGGDFYGTNVFLVTMFFNMFMYGLVINMFADNFLIKIASALMMSSGGYFCYMELHNPREWETFNLISGSVNVAISIMICVIIERIKYLKKNGKHRTDN